MAEVVARRLQVVEMIGMEANCRRQTRRARVLEGVDRTHAALHWELTELDGEIDHRIESSPAWRAAKNLLTCVSGISPNTVEPSLPRCDFGPIDGRRFATLVGVAPVNRDYGAMGGHRAIAGDRADVLYVAALTAARRNTVIRDRYGRLRQRCRLAKAALVAANGKLLTIRNGNIRDARPWPITSPKHSSSVRSIIGTKLHLHRQGEQGASYVSAAPRRSGIASIASAACWPCLLAVHGDTANSGKDSRGPGRSRAFRWHAGDPRHLLEGLSLGLPSAVDRPLMARRQATNNQAIGISRGRRSTKGPIATDHLGRAIAIHLTRGHHGDIQSADVLPAQPLPADRLFADRANDAAAAWQQRRHKSIEPVYRQREQDRRRHNEIADERRWRNQAATVRLEDFRRLTTCRDEFVRAFRDPLRLPNSNALAEIRSRAQHRRRAADRTPENCSIPTPKTDMTAGWHRASIWPSTNAEPDVTTHMRRKRPDTDRVVRCRLPVPQQASVRRMRHHQH